MAQSLIPSRENQATALSPVLSERLEREVFAPARSIGANLTIAAITEEPPPTEAKRSKSGTWWVASTFELDPVVLSNGGMTKAPAEVVTGLRSLREAGVDFDLVWVLNELPPEWVPGTPAPPMRILGDSDGLEIGRVVQTQETIFAAGLEALRLTGRALGLAARGAATVGVAAAVGIGEAIVLDPVILGGVRDPESGLIAWVPLAAWNETPA
jgi:hypothetical protein